MWVQLDGALSEGPRSSPNVAVQGRLNLVAAVSKPASAGAISGELAPTLPSNAPPCSTPRSLEPPEVPTNEQNRRSKVAQCVCVNDLSSRQCEGAGLRCEGALEWLLRCTRMATQVPCTVRFPLSHDIARRPSEFHEGGRSPGSANRRSADRRSADRRSTLHPVQLDSSERCFAVLRAASLGACIVF